jgi:arsenate reductase
MVKKSKVLFICVHNSFRSQMAEAWLNEICGEHFEVQSGGLEQGSIDPLAIEAMCEVGIDISRKRTRNVFDIWRSGVVFAYVITVCSEAERKSRVCPIFPGYTIMLSWPFPDPSTFQGSQAARLEQARLLRDAIKARVEDWCAEVCRPPLNSPRDFALGQP